MVGDNLGAQRGNQQRRAGEQDVAGEDRAVVTPQVLCRGHSPTRRRGVHDVVVVEGRQVRQLDGGGSRDDRVAQRALGITKLGAHEGQQRTHPLAAGDGQVTRQLVRQVTRG